MSNDFLKTAEKKAFDLRHRATLRYNIGQYEQKFEVMQHQFEDLERARRIAKNLRWAAIEQLDKLLLDFERNFKARGGQVIWADDAAAANAAVLNIAQHYNATSVVKSKSMVTEEIEVNKALEEAGIGVLETDLGEYIAQLCGERPYHVTAPILQKSKEEVAAILHQKFGTPLDYTPAQVTAFVREKLRYEYAKAEIGITGGNFIVADTGSIVVTENEGNARLTTAMPRVHIAIIGIEKAIASIKQLPLLLPLLATYSTGQRIATYNTLFSGPRQTNETDGPEAMYVILLNNGRTKLLADPIMRQSLYCIRCGACQNGCPVYRTIGGHSYDTTYSGPIGAVIEPHLQSLKTQGHLSYASSLCGNCTDVCPVKIDLHHLLLHNRELQVAQGLKKSDAQFWQVWQQLMLRRWVIDAAPQTAKNWGFRQLFTQKWGTYHALPDFPAQTFKEKWKAGDV